MSHTERTPSRRGLLARGTAALLTGAAIATAAHAAPVASLESAGADDAELIALCARPDAHMYVGLVEEIAEIPATTRAGLCAKARAMSGVLDVRTHSLDDVTEAHARHRLMLSLTRDVLAVIGRAAA